MTVAKAVLCISPRYGESLLGCTLEFLQSVPHVHLAEERRRRIKMLVRPPRLLSKLVHRLFQMLRLRDRFIRERASELLGELLGTLDIFGNLQGLEQGTSLLEMGRHGFTVSLSVGKYREVQVGAPQFEARTRRCKHLEGLNEVSFRLPKVILRLGDLAQGSL